MNSEFRFVVKVDVRGPKRTKIFLPSKLDAFCSRFGLDVRDIAEEVSAFDPECRHYAKNDRLDLLDVTESFVRHWARQRGTLIEIVDTFVLIDFVSQFRQVLPFLAGKSLGDQSLWLRAHGRLGKIEHIHNFYEFYSWYGRCSYLGVSETGVFYPSWILER